MRREGGGKRGEVRTREREGTSRHMPMMSSHSSAVRRRAAGHSIFDSHLRLSLPSQQVSYRESVTVRHLPLPVSLVEGRACAPWRAILLFT